MDFFKSSVSHLFMLVKNIMPMGNQRMKLELAMIGLVSLVLFSSVPTDGAQSNMSISIGFPFPTMDWAIW